MPTRILPFLLLGACLAPKSSETGDGDDSGSTGGGSDGVTAYDVNDGTIAIGEIVTLEGLVVTSPLTREGEGFFVADPAGGAGSGLYVWGPSAMEAVSVLQGDEVTITGEIQDYYGWLELTIGNADDVQVTGEAAVPAPVDLGTGEGVDWSQYESVLVTLADQTITGVDQYNTATLSGGIDLDDGFVLMDHGCGGTYASVGGIVFYSYEEWSINPRTLDDLGAFTGGGTSAGSVADVQQGTACGSVSLTGLVVTSPVDFDGEDSMFFVQDAGGGAYSGLAVFVPGAEVDVQVGDVVDVSGDVSEYYGFTELFVSDATTLVQTGGDAMPVSETLTAAPSDWEPYEGMLITLSDVEITGEMTDYGQLPTSYGILIDDLFVLTNAEEGDVFSSVTGVLNYSYEEWNLEPRTASDLVAQ